MKNASGSMIQYEKGKGLLRASDSIKYETPVNHFDGSGKFDQNLDVMGHCAAGSMSTGGIVAGSYGFGGPSFSVGSATPPSEVNVPERFSMFSMRRAITKGFQHSEPVMFDIPESIFDGDSTTVGTHIATRMKVVEKPSSPEDVVPYELFLELVNKIERLEIEIAELKNR